MIADEHCANMPGEQQTIDWACTSALDRLGFATSGELATFWETANAAEAKSWCGANLGNNLIEVEVEGARGSFRGKPLPDLIFSNRQRWRRSRRGEFVC